MLVGGHNGGFVALEGTREVTAVAKLLIDWFIL